MPGFLKNLGDSQYKLIGQLPSGPIGSRWSVTLDPEKKQHICADLVATESDAYQYELCSNVATLAKRTESTGLANVLETGWLPDNTFYLIHSLPASAQTLGSLYAFDTMSEASLWGVAAELIKEIRHLHDREIVHAVLSPRTIYKDAEWTLIADFWWAHDVEGKPFNSNLSGVISERWPDFALQFMAPEVLAGGSPTREADLYSLGAVLHFLISSHPPRAVDPTALKSRDLAAIGSSPTQSLRLLRPDLSKEGERVIQYLIEEEPAKRPGLLQLEELVDHLCKEVFALSPGAATQETFDWRPLKDNVSCDLYLYGKLANGPDYDNPGRPFLVTRSWLSEDMPFITLADPGNYLKSKFKLQWLLTLPEGTYALIEEWTGNLSDPRIRRQSIVKVHGGAEAGPSVVAIEQDELNQVIPHLQSDILVKRAWPVQQQHSELIRQAKDMLGKFPAHGSAEYQAQDLEEIGLTNVITFGLSTAKPGTTLKISQRWHIMNHLYVNLLPPGAKDEFEFALRWLAWHKSDRYAILLYPPMFTADDDVPPRIVVKVVSNDTIMLIDKEELSEIAISCIEEMDRTQACDPDEAAALLGAFPEWEEETVK